MKTRLSPSKSRKIQTHSPSPAKNSSLISNKYRQKSPPSPSRRRRRTHEQQEFIRSSSCGDLPSKNSLQKKQTKILPEEFVSHLTKIRTISKQIRNKNTNAQNGSIQLTKINKTNNYFSFRFRMSSTLE